MPFRVASMPRVKVGTEADKSLLAYLVNAKKIDATKAREIEHLGEAESLSAIQALVARGALTEEEIASTLAVGLRLPLIKLDRVTFDEQIAAFVKNEVAARCTFVPVQDADHLQAWFQSDRTISEAQSFLHAVTT